MRKGGREKEKENQGREGGGGERGEGGRKRGINFLGGGLSCKLPCEQTIYEGPLVVSMVADIKNISCFWYTNYSCLVNNIQGM